MGRRSTLTPEERIERRKQYNKRYYQAHKEEHNAKVRAYAQAHPDRIRASCMKWYAKNRDSVLAKQRKSPKPRPLGDENLDENILPFTEAQSDEQSEFVESYVRRHGIW